MVNDFREVVGRDSCLGIIWDLISMPKRILEISKSTVAELYFTGKIIELFKKQLFQFSVYIVEEHG